MSRTKKWSEKKRRIQRARQTAHRPHGGKRARLRAHLRIRAQVSFRKRLRGYSNQVRQSLQRIGFVLIQAARIEAPEILRSIARTGFAWIVLLLAFGMCWPGWKAILEQPPLTLWRAYPGAVSGFRNTSRGWVYLLKNGVEVLYSDGRSLIFEERVLEPDLQSILMQAYPYHAVPMPVPAGQEPGRVRNYEFFKAAYGGTPEAVKRNLVLVSFAGAGVLFNRNNGAFQALLEVAEELRGEPEAMAYLKKFNIRNRPGKDFSRNPNITTWNWRFIEGTQRLSAHGFGITIDLNRPHPTRPTYWRWLDRDKDPQGYERVSEIEPVPESLVKIFERHGFIWGGKWHHFDAMHFEYRPEFLQAQEEHPPRPAD